MPARVTDIQSRMPRNNKHIIIIISRDANKQIKSGLIDPDNERQRREGGALSAHRQGCRPQFTGDRLSDCTILF